MAEPQVPGSFWNPFHDKIDALRQHVDRRLDGLERMVSTIASSVADLDQALSDFETAADAADAADTAAEAEIQQTVNTILSKVGPGVDLTNEVARLQAAQQKRVTASTALKAAADAIQALGNPTPAPPTPTPTPTPAPPPAGHRR